MEKNFGKKSWRLFSFLGLFLLLSFPVFFFQNHKLRFEPPSARSGDEPHYLVLLSSIVFDKDLEVANNYNTVSLSQGRHLSSVVLDHHSIFVCKKKEFCKNEQKSKESNQRKTNKSKIKQLEQSQGYPKSILWNELFQLVFEKPSKPYFKIVPKVPDFDLSAYKEYGWHPPGYPVLLAIFLYYPVLQGYKHYESIIIVLQMFFYALALFYVGRIFTLKFWQLSALALALPLWYYNASFYTEGLAASLLLGALLFWHKRQLWASGLCLGLLVFVKEIYIPVVFLFLLTEGFFFGISANFFRRLASLATFSLLTFFLLIGKSYWIYGEFFRTYLPWRSSPTFFQNAFLSLLGSSDGIFFYSPVLIFSAVGLYRMQMGLRPLAFLIAAVFLIQFLITNASVHWSGGPSYANRLLVPVLAPLLLPLSLFWAQLDFFPLKSATQGIYKSVFLFLLFWSFLNSFAAVTHLHTAWGSPPYIHFPVPWESSVAP